MFCTWARSPARIANTSTWSVAAIALADGSNVITVDAAGNMSTDVLTVTVNTPPVLAVIANQSSQVGVAAVLQLTATDADGNVLTFSATGLPPGMTLTASTGVVSGTPVQAGTYSVTATVSDSTQSVSRTFSWTVTGDVTAPSVTITGPTSASTMTTASSSLASSGVASDVVGVTQVTWSNDRGGSGVAAGTTSWTTGGIVLQSGVNVVMVTARDAAGNTANDVVTVTYTAQQTNVAPTLAAVANQTSTVGRAVSLQLVGADANGDRLTYSASGLPAGLETGRLKGLMHRSAGPVAAAQRHRFHLEQLHQRETARQHAVAFEQRLAFDGIERRVLGEGIDQILIRHG